MKTKMIPIMHTKTKGKTNPFAKVMQKGAKAQGVKSKMKAGMPSSRVTDAILSAPSKKAKAIGAMFGK